MRLKPVIASYSGDVYNSIKRYLNADVLDIIATVARSPIKRKDIPDVMLIELVEMHILKEISGLVILDTSVFLRDDIAKILNTVTPLARELSQRVIEIGSVFQDAPPGATIFLGGILGLVQGLGQYLKKKHIAADWKNFTGKYARSKVDFDELCDIYDALGADYLNKTVLRGEKYTAVFIGPGGGGYRSLIQPITGRDASRNYVHQLNSYLVDAFAMLVKSEIQNASLYAAAEAAHLFRNGNPKTSVITDEILQKYEPAIKKINDISSSYYEAKLDVLKALLCSTRPGKQGVPPENMMLNLWRYIRKVTAKELYASGFFTDNIPEEETLTVFYDNDAEFVARFFI